MLTPKIQTPAVKLFKTINIEDVEKQINKFFAENPDLEIISISHADVGNASRIGLYQWTAIVAYKEKEK